MSTETILAAVKQHADQTAATLETMKASTDKRIKELDGMVVDLAQKNAGVSFSSMQPQRSKGIATMIESSGQLDGLRNRSAKSVQIPMDGVSVKALVNDSAATHTQFDTGAQRYDGIANSPMRKLSLLDAMQSLPVSAGTFEFNQLTAAYSNSAAEQVNQGDKKAVQVTTSALKTVTIKTVAVTEPVSEQVLADSPALSQFLHNRMMYNVSAKLEGLIATELVSEATAFTQTLNAATPDAISEAIAELDTKGWNASIIVMSPATWSALRTERSTLDGQYIAGSWAAPTAPSVFGVPVITSPTMADTTVLVLDSSQVIFLDRQQAAFAFGYSADGFERNLLTARAEVRGNVAVMAKGAVQKITLA